ncbi:hypothetical protein [Enterovibrio norvegicus]|uniref:Uncharacterized protein n=1 Tax=Enterovibrio norvegicus TaxID=188144 RepID=A0A2N7LBP6_9GAMM|nr:hypothetical protein [Enterovibrio norvegicus]PMN92695.1 hypothetical protein BCT23_14555 [Enterovibrio norvegicus]
MFKKTIINNTEWCIIVTFLLGSDSEERPQVSETKTFTVKSFTSVQIEYGNLKNGFINGIRILSDIGDRKVDITQTIRDENKELDDMLNNSFALEINSLNPLQIQKVS